MATIKFTNNYIRVNCDPTVKSINLFLDDKSEELPNDGKFSSKKYSGESKKAIVTYKVPPPAPTTYSVGQGVFFPDGAQVTITGGADGTQLVQAEDKNGNKGTWILVGADEKD
ncbi:uncharacterized protein FFUJ_00280 [Fusarium fujikuroi IMI 58289]|uniref:Uncharacterized protein n=1 Tax=Gibberella fujikuroi (strain CBS 195.34 / IMI 58289 / NRRL A-6831) TaxID=1279085 RepID=S0DKJ6_GIBF5|nr:uncharacterized protein FFUJ_00280 [Fusarium fujikuroi IMI 58289]KLP22180.1 uncharacterized protein LW94_14315 [Fusarium fujikuroi]CCT63104.1 uncharacterized protein FFUJ_00280 [Fusarium fujikuroi IMI 58289]SCN71972.1 uncharacterized protein FFM5_00291 [Fusarium fujikuroi]SCO30658.1 uncharacterized protein FFMR_01900 [Fusarium fujikuroi]